MAFWHELMFYQFDSLFSPLPGGYVHALFHPGSEGRKPLMHFMRYTACGPKSKIPDWQINPAGWVKICPREPFLASDAEEAREIFYRLLPGLEDGSLDDQFDIAPYRAPLSKGAVLIKEIEHPNPRCKSADRAILRWVVPG